jgi:hypothetical protein
MQYSTMPDSCPILFTISTQSPKAFRKKQLLIVFVGVAVARPLFVI